ncbi:MAG: YdcF family protein [Bacteroidetes bacterium]|nr:YdcF family protein [Bacteroidota bacterium]
MTDKEKFLVIVNTQQLQKADVVILLEGDGFTRINKACTLVNNGWANFLIFSGGIDNAGYGSFPFEQCRKKILATGIDESKIILELTSQHTRQQAEEVLKLCLQRGWNKIILVATHYHQYRAFLTFLKVLEELQLDKSIYIINAPATATWFEQMPWGKREQLLESEFDKIEKYKEHGHISTYEKALQYLERMETAEHLKN